MARQRVAEPGAVRKDEVGLKLGKAVGRDARIGEHAEAGIDAVDRLAASDDALDRGGGAGDALHRGVVETRLGAGPQLAQGREVDVRRVELHASTIGKSSPCSRAQSMAIS